MRKSFIGIVIVCLSLLCMIGCSADSVTDISSKDMIEPLTAPEDENVIVVGVSQMGSESVWRSANTTSVQETFSKESGYFAIMKNGRQKQENQIKDIRSFISQRVDYIIVAPVIESGWETVLKEAKDAGIPVIIMDRMLNVTDDSLYVTHVGSDMQGEGQRAGLWLEKKLAKDKRNTEEIDIVVIQGTRGSSAQRGRTKGFDTIAERHANWNILTQIDGDFTLRKGKEVMRQILKTYPDFDVLVCQNDDMAFGALEALDEAGIKTGVDGDVILISFDATKEALELVQQGIIDADVECNPDQGDDILRIIKKVEAGEPVAKNYTVSEKMFTIENVDLFIEGRTY